MAKKDDEKGSTFVDYFTNLEASLSDGDVKQKKIKFRFSLKRMYMFIDGKISAESNYVQTLNPKLPEKGFFERELKSVKELNSQGYNIKYEGPTSQEDFLAEQERISQFS